MVHMQRSNIPGPGTSPADLGVQMVPWWRRQSLQLHLQGDEFRCTLAPAKRFHPRSDLVAAAAALRRTARAVYGAARATVTKPLALVIGQHPMTVRFVHERR